MYTTKEESGTVVTHKRERIKTSKLKQTARLSSQENKNTYE